MDGEIDMLLWLSHLQATMEKIVSYLVPVVWTSIREPLILHMTGELDVFGMIVALLA